MNARMPALVACVIGLAGVVAYQAVELRKARQAVLRAEHDGITRTETVSGATHPREAVSEFADAFPSGGASNSAASGDALAVRSGEQAAVVPAPSALSQKQRVKLADERASMDRLFPEVAQVMHLSEQEADRFLDLLAYQALVVEENPPLVPAGELEWSEDHKPAWVLKAEEEQRQRDAELKSLVGATKFRVWEEYKRTVPARMLIRQWRSTLDGSSDSLREDQIPLLISAITDAQAQVNADLASGALNSSEHSQGYRRALHEAAAPYVTSTQLARLDKLVAKQVTGQDVLSDGQKTSNP